MNKKNQRINEKIGSLSLSVKGGASTGYLLFLETYHWAQKLFLSININKIRPWAETCIPLSSQGPMPITSISRGCPAPD